MKLRAVLVMMVTMVGCGATPTADLGLGQVSPAAEATPLTADEASDLRFLREEEKLAHDVYVALANRWGANVFTNISSSEQTHTDSVGVLLRAYGIDDPAVGRRQGEFENATLQALHDDLVAKGTARLVDALSVGATIEDLDLFDLARLTDRTTRPDLLTVYGDLARGSRNHLRSFNGQLTNLGAVYAPRYLTVEAFNAIITTPTERGR